MATPHNHQRFSAKYLDRDPYREDCPACTLSEDAKRLYAATEAAEDAFWSVVADQFHEIKTGDFPPDAQAMFHQACERAVDIWLTFNDPNRQSGG